MFYVYCYENLINKKCYIGKTCNISQRKNRHRRNAFKDNLSLPFYNALRKYSESGFSFKILDQFDKEYVIFDLEKFYIKAYNSTNPKFGYNITEGGEGSCGTKHNDNQKRSNKLKFGSNNGNSKLNDTSALEIYHEYKSGVSSKDLVSKYNVSAITIERLLAGKSWKHLNLDISRLSQIKKENIVNGRKVKVRHE
jgi:group I intron endonuclease